MLIHNWKLYTLLGVAWCPLWNLQSSVCSVYGVLYCLQVVVVCPLTPYVPNKLLYPCLL